MSEWIKVITSPLGLAGFALSLVFGYLGRAKRNDVPRWFPPTAYVLAAVALVSCLFIAYKRIPKPPPQPLQKMTNSNVRQTSTGEGSPNVQGVQGDVTITVDQSKGKTEVQKAPAKKPTKENK